MPETFDFEKAIESWRIDMASRNIRNGSLEELERHLRDAFAQLRSEGVPEAEAWERATSELGDSRRLASEFAQVDRYNGWDALALLGIGIAVCASIRFVVQRVTPSDTIESLLATQPLLMVHIVAVSLAACFAVLVGFCGAFVLTRRRLSDDPCPRVEALFRKLVIAFSWIVFVGSLGGFILGLIWGSAVSGVHTAWYDIRVLGCVALILWSGASLWFIVWRKIGSKWLFRLAIVGSVIITETWLFLMIFGGSFSILVALVAILLYAVQLIPFCLNWKEDFPEKVA